MHKGSSVLSIWVVKYMVMVTSELCKVQHIFKIVTYLFQARIYFSPVNPQTGKALPFSRWGTHFGPPFFEEKQRICQHAKRSNKQQCECCNLPYPLQHASSRYEPTPGTIVNVVHVNPLPENDFTNFPWSDLAVTCHVLFLLSKASDATVMQMDT